jgi:hypothetical protein
MKINLSGSTDLSQCKCVTILSACLYKMILSLFVNNIYMPSFLTANWHACLFHQTNSIQPMLLKLDSEYLIQVTKLLTLCEPSQFVHTAELQTLLFFALNTLNCWTSSTASAVASLLRQCLVFGSIGVAHIVVTAGTKFFKTSLTLVTSLLRCVELAMTWNNEGKGILPSVAHTPLT